jgi:hypothetical protein
VLRGVAGLLQGLLGRRDPSVKRGRGLALVEADDGRGLIDRDPQLRRAVPVDLDAVLRRTPQRPVGFRRLRGNGRSRGLDMLRRRGGPVLPFVPSFVPSWGWVPSFVPSPVPLPVLVPAPAPVPVDLSSVPPPPRPVPLAPAPGPSPWSPAPPVRPRRRRSPAAASRAHSGASASVPLRPFTRCRSDASSAFGIVILGRKASSTLFPASCFGSGTPPMRGSDWMATFPPRVPKNQTRPVWCSRSTT